MSEISKDGMDSWLDDAYGDPYKYVPTKPLYMLIKLEVDKEIVVTERDSEKYAQNHCNSFEYELVECYYPDDVQYPYIAK